jgi:hypothetical protein
VRSRGRPSQVCGDARARQHRRRDGGVGQWWSLQADAGVVELGHGGGELAVAPGEESAVGGVAEQSMISGSNMLDTSAEGSDSSRRGV